MSTKWTSTALPGNEGVPAAQGEAERFVVLLLYGKNSFGDKIYSYLKITLPNLQQLKAAIQSGNKFNPSDFGTVIAAGKGDPTPEVRTEVAAMYEVLDTQKSAASQPLPEKTVEKEKKKWDEY